VTVYQPIKLSSLVEASILGRHRRETRFGGHVVRTADVLSPVVQAGLLDQENKKASPPKTGIDDTREIQFAAQGRLLMETEPMDLTVRDPTRNARLSIRFNQTNDTGGKTVGMRETFRQLMLALSYSEVGSNQESCGFLRIQGERIPLKDIMDEVCR
jgi:hypothetical protein